jgi:hypothetical protein
MSSTARLRALLVYVFPVVNFERPVRSFSWISALCPRSGVTSFASVLYSITPRCIDSGEIGSESTTWLVKLRNFCQSDSLMLFDESISSTTSDGGQSVPPIGTGESVGERVGGRVGVIVGGSTGVPVGAIVGTGVGTGVGGSVGVCDGDGLGGLVVGDSVGVTVGAGVGSAVGVSVG